MKKLFTFIAVICLALNASAQQLPNNEFDYWKTSCGSTYAWSYTIVGGWSKGLRQRPGVEPTGWEGSSLNQQYIASVSKDNLVTKTTGETSGSNAVKLLNIRPSNLSSLRAPGFISFAIPWVYPHSNAEKADGGVYGGMEFTYRPDAIQVLCKRTKGEADEKAHIIYYSWKGTFKSNIGCEDDNNTLEVEDQDRAVFGLDTPNSSGTLIAKCDKEFTTTTDNDWQIITVPIEYQTSDVPEKVNVILCSGDYWTRTNMKTDSQLDVDWVKLLYYSELASATYDGADVNFSDGAAMVEAPQYDASKLELTSNGHGAKIQKSYDNATGLLTITITAEDNSKSNTYTIQFYKKGDINNDGQVTIADVTSLVNIILGKQTDYKMPVADVNGDKGVTIADVTALVNIILGKN